MALSIKSKEADRLARELSDLTGETLTEAVVASLELRLADERRRRQRTDISDIIERFQQLPVLDGRPMDEILGYDADGLPS